ncbi:hypothetical protein INT47_006993 [Mucor saturninus]|uniref:Uncharacterized protein n=1 Tax=Mucor saturninus TaxID=64648 RepID=A0A8H7UYH0_9FUNG|nr:hypothetical protein INT47_006993 [Mucor saturninus]
MYSGNLLGKTVGGYCQRLETYLENRIVKRLFMAHYRLKEQAWREDKSKESLNAETRIASNVVISRRIREIGDENSSDENAQIPKRHMLNQDHENNASDPETSPPRDNIDQFFNPVSERTSALTIVKNQNVYRFQTPCNNVLSPNKPIIQKEDLANIKGYFDICIGSSSSESSSETRSEFDALMKRQAKSSNPANPYPERLFTLETCCGYEYDWANLESLKELDTDIMGWVMKVMACPEQEMFRFLAGLPDHSFLNCIKFTMVDFLLNCMRTQKYNDDDERTPYCEIFIPIFKAFGNTTHKPTYVWCEKKAKDSDYIWLATNNFTREKGNVKLLDGIGSLTITDLN